MDCGAQSPIPGFENESYNTPEKRECRERLLKHTVECLKIGRQTSTCVQRDHVKKVWPKFDKSGEAFWSFQEKEVKRGSMECGRQSPTPGLDNESYNTPEKRECQERVIKHAVECLTTGRETSTCVKRDHVRKAWDKFEKSGEAYCSFQEKGMRLIKGEIEEWELFHDSQTQKKKPQDLRVCYLAGENPMNDLNVLRYNGVLCQNIWVIEKNSGVPRKVWEDVIKSRFTRNVRFFKDDFLTLMKDDGGKFDIIYFGNDPLSTEQGTLEAIRQVFLYNKLASPGALITTFYFLPKNAEDNNLRKYLAARLKNTIGHPSKIEEFLESRSDEENYSDFIFYQVIDTAYMDIPTQRMHKLSSRNRKSLKICSTSPQNSKSLGQQTRKSNYTDCATDTDFSSVLSEDFLRLKQSINQLQLLTSSLEQMVTSLQYGQIAHPSYIVPEKHLGLKHTSSEGKVFSDVFIFDNCQYVFQQFPSVDYEYSAIFQPEYLWVIQTITEGLANKLAFIYRDVFEHFQSVTSYEPMEIPQRAAIRFFLLKKEGEIQMSNSRYEDALLKFYECFKFNHNDESHREIERYMDFCLNQVPESFEKRSEIMHFLSNFKKGD